MHSLLDFQFNGLDLIMAILAVAAGAVLLFKSGLGARWGTILLGLWLVVSGLMTLISLAFAASGVVMGILALAAGVLLLIDK